ncbi:MAG: carboxypeptidase regulatory-like domain-containing protein, partial [Terriglobia bacterium]
MNSFTSSSRLPFRAAAMVILLVAAGFCLVRTANAQAAAISGAVRDTTGAALANVRVTATNMETGVWRVTVTNQRGEYDFLSLPVGRYEIRMEKQGFRQEIREGITVAVGQQVMVNAAVPLGQTRQRLKVTGGTPLLSLTTRQVSGLVGQREISSLPLNGRSYDELLTLNPGILNYTAEKTGGIGVSNSAVGNMFAASGRRPQENLFLLDGVEYTGVAEIDLQPGGTSGELLGVDAIREFNVLTGTYGAEYGKRPGSQVLLVTQSGSNSFHGDVYEFLRNSDFDARNFFDHGPIPPFERNQFGAAMGGPLQRNTTFIFGNYEGFRQRLGLSDVTLVPDDNARQGLLPATNGSLTNIGVAPGVAPLLSLWPVQDGPELGGGIAEAFSHPIQNIREDFGTTRLDHTFSPTDSLSGTYLIDDSADFTPTADPISVDLESLREQVLSLQETHVFSPALLNTARFGFSRASYFYTGGTTVNVPGFVAGDPVGAVSVGGSATPNSASEITLTGSNIGSHLFAARNLFTYEDTLAGTRGLHQLTAGVWLQRIQANDTLALGQYGQAVFSSLSNFLKGDIST